MTKTRLAAVAATLALTGGAFVAATGAADAATGINYPCQSGDVYGDMCFYYHSNYAGASVGIWTSDGDEYDTTFEGGGAGSGQAIANNAGSGANFDTVVYAENFEHVNSTGRRVQLAPYQGSTTFGVLNNNNRSLSWSATSY